MFTTGCSSVKNTLAATGLPPNATKSELEYVGILRT